MDEMAKGGGWVQKPVKIKKDVYKFEDHQGVGYIVKRGVGERVTPMWIVSNHEDGTWDGSHHPFYTKKDAEKYIESFFAKGGGVEKWDYNTKYLTSAKAYFDLKNGKVYPIKNMQPDMSNGKSIDDFDDSWFESLNADDFGTVKNYIDSKDEMSKGGNVGDSGNITDSKSMYQGKRGIIEMDMGNEWIVKILDNGKEKSVTVRKSGFKVMDDDFAKGGYTEPSYDLPIRGKYKFVTKDGKEFILNVTRYERENDTEDSLVISQDQDKLRDEFGSIIIKNSAWRNLTKLGKTVMARASKGSTGKITKINDTLAKGGMAKGWSHKKK
jgi:hypothetical protein